MGAFYHVGARYAFAFYMHIAWLPDMFSGYRRTIPREPMTQLFFSSSVGSTDLKIRGSAQQDHGSRLLSAQRQVGMGLGSRLSCVGPKDRYVVILVLVWFYVVGVTYLAYICGV